MNQNQLYRLSGLAAIVSGVLSMIASGAGFAAVYIPAAESLSFGLMFNVASTVEPFAFMGYYGKQAKTSGYAGLAGFFMVIAGNILILGKIIPLLYGGILYVLGMALLALGAMGTRKTETTAIWLMCAGSLASFGASFVGLQIVFLGIGPAVFNVGMIILGVGLLKTRETASAAEAALMPRPVRSGR